MADMRVDDAVSRARRRVEEYKDRPKTPNGKVHSTRRVKPFVQAGNDGPRLVVKIIRAEDLIACDKQAGKSDPVCFIRCGSEELQTDVRHGTINPKWNQEFQFGDHQNVLDLLPTGNLEIVLRDEDVVEGVCVFSDLGKIEMPLVALTGKNKRRPPQWCPLQPTENMKKTTGRLLCSVRLTGCEQMNLDVVDGSSPRKFRIDTRPASPVYASPSLSPLRMAERSPSKLHHRSFVAETPFLGDRYRVSVSILQARYFDNLVSESCLICEVVCGNERLKTLPHSNRSSEGWNEQLVLGIDQYIHTLSTFLIRVRAQSPGKQCLEDIGEMTMPLSSILSGNSRLIGERWYPTSMNGQMTGEIRLRIHVDLPADPSQLPIITAPIADEIVRNTDQFKSSVDPIEENVPALTISIQSGRDLPVVKDAETGSCDATCYIRYGVSKIRTQVVTQSSNPVWDETFQVPLVYPMSTVELTVKDESIRDGVLTYEDLGQVQIPIRPELETEQSGWYPLRSQLNANRPCGEIYVTLSITGLPEVAIEQVKPVSLKTARKKPRALTMRKRQSQDKQLMEEVNDMLTKLEDRDTQDLAMNFLKDAIISLKPQLFGSFFKAVVRNKNPERTSTRRDLLKLVTLLCQKHPTIAASDPILDKILAYIASRLMDTEVVVHSACATAVGCISLHVLPHLITPGDTAAAFAKVRAPFFVKLREVALPSNSRLGAAMCLSSIVRPPMSRREVRIITTSSKLSNATVQEFMKSCDLEFTTTKIQDNVIVIPTDPTQAMSIYESIRFLKIFPTDWTVTVDSAHNEEQFNGCNTFQTHCERLKSCLATFIADILVEVKRPNDISKTEAPLWVAVDAATIAKEALDMGIPVLKEEWIPIAGPYLIYCKQILTSSTKVPWKAAKKALQLIRLLASLLSSTELEKYRHLIEASIERGSSSANKFVRTAAQEAATALENYHGTRTRESSSSIIEPETSIAEYVAEVNEDSPDDEPEFDQVEGNGDESTPPSNDLLFDAMDDQGDQCEAPGDEFDGMDEDGDEALPPEPEAIEKLIPKPWKIRRSKSEAFLGQNPPSDSTCIKIAPRRPSMTKRKSSLIRTDSSRSFAPTEVMDDTESIYSIAPTEVNQNESHSFIHGVQTAFAAGHVDNAFRIALKSEDKVLLLRLMSSTRPCWGELSKATRNVLISSFIQILSATSHAAQVLPWIGSAFRENVLLSLDPRVVTALEYRLHGLSSLPNDHGVLAAKLYYDIQKSN